MHTVLMEPIVCATTVAASESAACFWEARLPTSLIMTTPAMTRGGIEDNIVRVRSHPLKNAIRKPPMNEAPN